MILACHNLNKAFGGQVIVRDGSFHIEDREKAALVGVNGAGKSTILKMIVKEEPVDSGEIVVTKGKTLGYLAQQQKLEGGRSIYEEVKTAKADIIELENQIRAIEKELKSLSGEALQSRLDTYHRMMSSFEAQNGYAYESELTGVLKGLGFQEEDFDKKTDTLSGGQKTRVSLGKLLLTKPDILLLDEPTNHLDLNSITWLETYLLNYPGAVFIVSHDRFFLNRVVTKVVEIEHGTVRMYAGNYKAYADKKQQIRDAMMKEYLNQQREIKHQEAVIEKLRSFNREKSIKRAESREKLLDKMTLVDKPQEAAKEIHFSLEPSCLSGNDVLSVEGLSKSFDSQTLFTDISFDIRRGEHVAVIGDNGTGKTTLLKIINQVVPPDTGSFTLGSKVRIGYYDQEHHVLHDQKNIFDEISDDYPTLNNTQIRNTLAAFQFTGDDVYKLIGDLSGGEKGRVSLAKLMLSEANFLILDEPTNHLDITSKEILEKAVNDYTGTVLYVSHDRYFINQTATRILELVNQTFVNYIGNYDYYLEKKEELTAVYTSPAARGTDNSGIPKESVSDAKLSWQEQKEQQARERKRQNELKKTEERITVLEERNEEIDELMTHEDVYSNSVKCQELAAEKASNEGELEILYEKWEELAE
ncbi:ABC-F type ribosomal protection protein [Muricomes sp. OA1]|uniref:ABC transporter ATP-binding protein n=1 Tax=Hungatella hathewayi TaxID=154046 RepID=A0A3E2WWU1_9FIRM|nr:MULTISPECIES: ABC-F type ribosomal protection protein [Clostridia]MCH1974182.1 ABC-F type ribosomal protection protein [Muricomes sp. OA1]RGC32411.1 ABC transporter ATP-binding protein [Hungatella hathewayi]GKH32952.1 thiamine ABC transporter substrate-binding protein [Faecalicatena contorta]